MNVKAIAAALVVVTFAACDSTNSSDPTAMPTTLLSPSPTITASISQPAAPFQSFASTVCAGASHFSPMLDLVITSPSPIDVEQVMFQMMDGSHIGPALLFPHPILTNQFGSTVILGNTSRTFRFQPEFPCGQFPMGHVSASIYYRDHQGSPQSIVTSAPYR